MFQTTKCLQCAGEYKMYAIKKANGTLPEGARQPIIREAITLAPSWQQQQIGGQMVLACVAVPVCEDHIGVGEVSAMDRAMMGGRLIKGSAG